MADLKVISEGRGEIHSHVIFFHGLAGDPHETWQSPVNPPVCWPQWLAEDIEGLAVWSIGYEAAVSWWDGMAMNLPDRAMNVLERILLESRLKTGEIILVGHSLGGLLIKQILRTAESIGHQREDAAEFMERLRRVAFLATPHFGADLAAWGDRLRIIVLPSAATACLVRNDPHLRELNNWYREWVIKSGISHLILTETQPTKKFFIVVKPDSSDPGLIDRPIPIDADHNSICKPCNKSSEIYLYIREFVDFNTPSIEITNAHEANTKWLTDGFSDRRQARNQFGHALSPGDITSIKTLTRKALADELQQYLARSPDEKVVFVLGGEGCGKSWIVAQSWLTLDQKPLMVFLTPETFKESAAQNDINELLIVKLIEQTGDKPTDIKQRFWRRSLIQWRRSPSVIVPRLIVTIDGINQKPNVDWGRIIDNTGAALEEIGGRLVITSRTPYFRDRVKKRLTVPTIEINVPEWIPTERDEILRNYGISPAALHATVAQSLLNPRLLGIAVELLNKDDISALEELSVSRLLFEHIRASVLDAPTPQSVGTFVRRLREHAQKILDRKQQQHEDDLNIFEADTPAVADGRFFLPVEGEPEKYQLKDDGLTLALGFSVVDQLRVAKRNDRDLDVTLTTLLEPISALDSTANVVLAALTVAVVDDDHQYIQNIAVALVKGFASLQNPDETKFPTFAGLTKSKPLAFMKAAHDLCLDGADHQNFDWIQFAVIEASKNVRIWPEIANEIRCWMSVYSLSPELRMQFHLSRDSIEKVQTEREKNQQAINDKLDALSKEERNVLNRLHQKEGSINSLTRLGLYVLAGKPLAPFAESFLNWSFSTSLNSEYSAPYKELSDLVSLNRVDWRETRMALLKACEPLRGSNISNTGKWALVTILGTTGEADDDGEAQALVNELRKDQPTFKGQRPVERYSATDPCDPTSAEPDNITQTMEKYQAIDVTQLRMEVGMTIEDDFFIRARPSMARFKSKVAVAKHREFAENVLTRSGFPLRQGLFELLKHNALLTSAPAHALVTRWRQTKSDDTLNNLTKQDSWIVSQYHLLLAFPLLSANEQTEILLSVEEDENILLELMNRMSPLDESTFERLFNEAIKSKDEYKQYLLLAIAKSTNTPLSLDTRRYIASLVSTDSDRLRAEALGVVATLCDNDMLAIVARSSWNAANAKIDDSHEEWYGSTALLKAAERHLIDHREVLDRISPRLYGKAAIILNIEARREIARRINISIEQTIGLEGNLVAPDIELEVRSDGLYEPNRFSVTEKAPPTQDITEAMKRFNESSRDFEERQKRIHEIFIDFKNTLTKVKASIILDDLMWNEFAVIIAADEYIADKWYKLFIELPDSNLSAVHNLILLLAHVLSGKDPGKSQALFKKVRNSRPIVRCTFDSVGVELDAMVCWTGERSDVLDEQRAIRLDQAGTDHDLSLEVLAGLMNGQQEFLEQYINNKLTCEEPAEIARGIMVAGFSDISKFNSEILSRYEKSAGLIGQAHKAAKYAYERNSWARHWFGKMCEAAEPNDFWCSVVLFNKITDGRFVIWDNEYPRMNMPIIIYGNTWGYLKNRYKRWEEYRKKKLFGNDAPAVIFLEGGK